MIKYKLPDYLSDCPLPWRNFIKHCQRHCPRDQAIERYVNRILLERYNCAISDDEGCATFRDDELYTLFLMEWS